VADPADLPRSAYPLTDGHFAKADGLAASFAERDGQPGIAYGIVAGGALVHSGGRGERWLGGPPPDAGTIFRIASMTKSFTAATIMLLRDEGALALDDLAEKYVPELRGVALPSADSPRPTLRQLLTMTAGFPTDDPWGDRQQGLAAAEFSRLLADGGVAVAWAPGTRFEYSNLGYAVLGKVIEAVTGERYSDVIAGRMVRPLGLIRTGYEVSEFDPAQLARGYQRGSGGWSEVTPDGNGAFSPMGGIFSTVADLARWVSGFADAFPPRDGDGAAHPLSRAARREMQLSHVAMHMRPEASFPDAASMHYGFGLFIEEDPVLGTVVQHSGGYPGFGSQMRWHPATGVGTIALGNGTYSAVGELTARMLAELVGEVRAHRAAAGDAPALVRGPAPGDGQPWPQTLAARAEVDRLLQGWDDAIADGLFSPNVDWDQSFADRRAAIGRVRDRIGEFQPAADRAVQYDSPAHCRWWLRGERGTVQVEIQLTPLTRPLVQSLRLAVPPAPGSVLLRLLDSLIGLLNDGSPQWPEWLPVAADVNTAHLSRRLRVAAAWAGRCTVASFQAGDGESSTTAELEGPSGRVVLAISVDESAELLRQADVTLLP
jgi:CubicO group peptidase (beta-lactamase class C family)